MSSITKCQPSFKFSGKGHCLEARWAHIIQLDVFMSQRAHFRTEFSRSLNWQFTKVNCQNTLWNRRCLMKWGWIFQILREFFLTYKWLQTYQIDHSLASGGRSGKIIVLLLNLNGGIESLITLCLESPSYPAGIMWVVCNNGKSFWLYYRRSYSKAIKLIVKLGLALQKMISKSPLFS